jgi:hypothetical protein
VLVILASIVPVEAPPHRPDASDELDALIEEARRRARRRRLGYLALVAAAALAAGGIYLAFGGGGGDGAPGGSASNEPGAAATPGSSSSSEAAGYQCPTSIAALKKSRPGSGVPGCRIRFSATLPAGWDEGPTRLTVYPSSLTGLILTDVRYANFPLAATGPATGPLWPISIPPDGIAIGIFPQAPASRAEPARASAVHLRPGDFRRVPVQRDEPVAGTRLYRGGWRFQAQVRVGASQAQSQLVDEANAVLNSIETTERLCPCGHAASPLRPAPRPKR